MHPSQVRRRVAVFGAAVVAAALSSMPAAAATQFDRVLARDTFVHPN